MILKGFDSWALAIICILSGLSLGIINNAIKQLKQPKDYDEVLIPLRYKRWITIRSNTYTISVIKIIVSYHILLAIASYIVYQLINN